MADRARRGRAAGGRSAGAGEAVRGGHVRLAVRRPEPEPKPPLV